MEILYRDRWLLIAEKPIGMLSEKTDGGEDILSVLERETGGYVGCVHRLDRTTGGAMVFSADKSVTGRLSEAIRAREFTKEYLAVLEGVPAEPEGILTDLLFHDRRINKVFVVSGERKGAKQASLAYRVLAVAGTEKGERTLVRVTLHTGRTHQIRVQFASRGLPLAGDGKYGGRDNRSHTAALWSYHLRFAHPVTGKTVEAFSFPPEEQYPWSLWQGRLREVCGGMENTKPKNT